MSRVFGVGGESLIARLLVVSVILLLRVFLSGVSLAAQTESSVEDAPSAVAIMGLEEIERGQRGYGYSVFAGHELERFEFEVLGVVQDRAPGQDDLMVRLSGQGLEHSGVIAGMSGSPVYIDGRLVGAVAYSWAFAKDPIAGITPIASMRAIGESTATSTSASGDGFFGEPPTVTSLLQMGEAEDRMADALSRLQVTAGGSQTAPALGWGVSGFSGSTQLRLSQTLGPLAPVGRSGFEPTAEVLLPGSSVAAVLVDGDLRLAATGTVTDRIGDDVLAFGHPFYSLGEISLPMAEAEIITVMPSQANSFKIANLGRTVGSFRQDRQAGVRGQIGLFAETTPLDISIRTPELHQYHMELARIPQLTAALAAVSTLGAQNSASTTTGPMGIDLHAEFDLGSHGVVALDQSFDGLNAATEAAIFVMSYLNFFDHNAFSSVTVDAVNLDLVQHAAPRSAILIGGYADRTEVRPGETVGLSLEFAPYRGELMRHRTEIELPADLPAGRYSLLVGDGVSIDLQRQKIEPASPVRFEQALRVIRGFHSRRDLVVLGLHSGHGLAVAGEVLPRLPGSMQSIWTAAASKSAVPLSWVVAQEYTERLELPMAGAVRIDLKVLRPDPVTSADNLPSEGGSVSDDSTSGEGGSSDGADSSPSGNQAGGAEE
ncbi:MAG: hypothetical protein K8J08_17170 [Thermoanaerobaculia bacterium]|nr:hypothetical protein [Thermoanaerobaculia bacterium]